MKKLLTMLIVVVSFASHAGNIWITNANPFEPVNMEIYTTGGGATLLLNIEYGAAGLLVFTPSTTLQALEASGTGELTFVLPSLDGDYTCNFDFSDPPSFVPVPVPEPTPTAFFLGFGTMLSFWGFGAMRRMASRTTGGGAVDF